MQSDRLEVLLRGEREVVPEAGAEERIWAGVEHRPAHGPAPPSGADVAPDGRGGRRARPRAQGDRRARARSPPRSGVWGATRLGPGAPGRSRRRRSKLSPRTDVGNPRVDAAPGQAGGRRAGAGALSPRSSRRSSGARVRAGPEEPAQAIKKTAAHQGRRSSAAKVDGGAGGLRRRAAAHRRDPAAPLKQGDSARALARVDEHARRFGARGQLVQERLALPRRGAVRRPVAYADARRVARRPAGRSGPIRTDAPRVKKRLRRRLSQRGESPPVRHVRSDMSDLSCPR